MYPVAGGYSGGGAGGEMISIAMIAVGVISAGLSILFGPEFAAKGTLQKRSLNIVLWLAVALTLVGLFNAFSGNSN